MAEQIISKAYVSDRTDLNKSGSFLALIEALDSVETRIWYTSPYASNSRGGIIAIPEKGVEILVVRPSCSDSWYYLASTFTPEAGDAKGDPVPDAGNYPFERATPPGVSDSNTGIPDTMNFTNSIGEGLIINKQNKPPSKGGSQLDAVAGYLESKGLINRQVKLRSSENKALCLNDSPGIDCIELNSGNGSRLKLTSTPGGEDGMDGAVMGVPDRAFLVETEGPQRLISGSQIDVVVDQGGRELQLLNQANDVEWGDDIYQGSVNIQSKWKDVNVLTLGASGTGRIFIQCLDPEGNNNGQLIQIETKGTNGNISIKTVGNITLNAEGGTLNVNADTAINMKTGKFSLACDSIEVAAGGEINIDGSKINLADGANPEAPSLYSTNGIYGAKGVTSYK